MTVQQDLLVTALLLACGTAQASDWVSVAENKELTTELFVDVSSIRVTDNIRRMWTKLQYKSHTKDDKNKWVDHDISRSAYNCAEELTRLESLIIYYEDGDSDTLPMDPIPDPWMPVPPDTLRWVELEFVCAWSKETS